MPVGVGILTEDFELSLGRSTDALALSLMFAFSGVACCLSGGPQLWQGGGEAHVRQGVGRAWGKERLEVLDSVDSRMDASQKTGFVFKGAKTVADDAATRR